MWNDDDDFVRTSDGLAVISVDGTTFAAIPFGSVLKIRSRRDDGLPIDGLTERDFPDVVGHLDRLEYFRSEIVDIVSHRRERAALDRRDVDSSVRTPWGRSQGASAYADGVLLHFTAGHGGFQVFAKPNRAVPEPYRNANGWYEEDAEWAKVAAGLPHLFTARERRAAEETLINWFPDEYELVNGIVIPEGWSIRKDERIFKQRHTDDWVVISAITAEEPGLVRCTATRGGERGGWYSGIERTPEERHFLVPNEEYARRGRHGFVVDPNVHVAIDPSVGTRP